MPHAQIARKLSFEPLKMQPPVGATVTPPFINLWCNYRCKPDSTNEITLVTHKKLNWDSMHNYCFGHSVQFMEREREWITLCLTGVCVAEDDHVGHQQRKLNKFTWTLLCEQMPDKPLKGFQSLFRHFTVWPALIHAALGSSHSSLDFEFILDIQTM